MTLKAEHVPKWDFCGRVCVCTVTLLPFIEVCECDLTKCEKVQVVFQGTVVQM